MITDRQIIIIILLVAVAALLYCLQVIKNLSKEISEHKGIHKANSKLLDHQSQQISLLKLNHEKYVNKTKQDSAEEAWERIRCCNYNGGF